MKPDSPKSPASAWRNVLRVGCEYPIVALYYLSKRCYLCLMKKRGRQNLFHHATHILVFVAAVSYTTFSIGVVKATHFCMGREASVALFTTEAQKCACAVFAGEKDTCCDDVHELIRLDDDQKTISKVNLNEPSYVLLEELELPVVKTSFGKRQGRTVDPGPPPLKAPLWKIHCSLVFYDSDMNA